MFYYNDFSLYKAENILDRPAKPSHSGPELCVDMLKSTHADKLAREVVLDKISLLASEQPSWTTITGKTKSYKIRF
ncbi:MAG: hypothetical protein WCH46_09365 [bacterium]